MHDDPTEHTCPHGSRPIDERCDTCWREENEDPIDFAMLTPPTRLGPCKAAAAPEVDPVEKRLEREYLEACHIKICNLQNQADMAREYERQVRFRMGSSAIEVKHGSGKVKV